MATSIIKVSNHSKRQGLECIKTLPFDMVAEEKKKTFREAANECDAVPARVFTDELRRRIDQWTEGDA
ncbi:MAG: hypothetical protein ACK5LR_05575 [Mangrovibacterium sp.]